MKAITTHILDTATGRPASGVGMVLERERDGGWATLFRGETNADGRATLVEQGALEAGNYRVTFDTGGYHAGQGVRGFYPRVQVDFVVEDATQHFHVPLLVSPFGFSTYRGS